MAESKPLSRWLAFGPLLIVAMSIEGLPTGRRTWLPTEARVVLLVVCLALGLVILWPRRTL